MTGKDKTIQERALRAYRERTGDNGATFTETLGPILISARSLHGSSPFWWGTRVLNVREIFTPVTHEGRSAIHLHKLNGRISFDLLDVHTFAFYVECAVRLSDPAMRVRWDARMSQTGPVDGRAIRDPATGLYYFATPPAADQGIVNIAIDAQVVEGPEDGVLILNEIEILGFR